MCACFLIYVINIYILHNTFLGTDNSKLLSDMEAFFSKQTNIIAVAAGGGGLILMIVIIVLVCLLCKKRDNG